MDRIEAMKIFVATLDEGSLAGAGRRLGRSPASVSRAIAFLEGYVGVRLLHRTTRSTRLSEIGERYAAACRRVLSDLNEADVLAVDQRSHPGGTLTIGAPMFIGEDVLRPIVDDFLDVFPTVSAQLSLADRPVNPLDERIDVALSAGHLRDSSMLAIRVGEVREVIVGAPAYLANCPQLDSPYDLTRHRLITVSHAPVVRWTFPPNHGSTAPRTVTVKSRCIVNSTRAATLSAVEGRGLTRLLSCQVGDHVRAGRLQIVLSSHECSPLPLHLIIPGDRISTPKVRAFVDFGLHRLRAQFARLGVDVSPAVHLVVPPPALPSKT
jgi:DNA-binding transcriptional LysR family regulator